LALLSGLALAACGDDPVAYSETVSVKLSGIKNGDIANGQASEDKNINTESGNPYGEFVKRARDRLGGRDPSAIEIIKATVQVHADSKNISTIDAVFSDIEIFMADSATTIPVGSRATPTGTSVPVPIDDDIDYEPVFSSMLGGDFKVGVRGSTVTLPPDDFDLKLTIDLRFTAYE
jgi:hypothetical protein